MASRSCCDTNILLHHLYAVTTTITTVSITLIYETIIAIVVLSLFFSLSSRLPQMHLPAHRLSSPYNFYMPSTPPTTSKYSPLTRDASSQVASENNDFCSACGGTGYLLCCDGCDRSFHFSCLDPPLSEDAKELDEPWYCYVCLTKRPGGLLDASPEKVTRGLFAPLFATLKKQNPTNYILPAEIRDFFEGVATDKQGGFVEAMTKTTRYVCIFALRADYSSVARFFWWADT